MKNLFLTGAAALFLATGAVGPNFVAGLVIKDDRVIRAAPILGYTIGWTTERVSALAQRRGWTVEYDTR